MPNLRGFLKHMGMSARRQDTRGGRDDWGAGITSAQHPMRETPKAVHDSYLPAIIGTASPNLHIEPRRRSAGDRDPGALSLSPARSRISPHPGTRTQATTPAPVAQWIEQAPSKRLAAGSSPAGGASRTDGCEEALFTVIPSARSGATVLPSGGAEMSASGPASCRSRSSCCPCRSARRSLMSWM